ncbi:CPBP family intramembrane metalloprotease [Piscinibacter aquaticus]|uniref:CPBP family intramembrane metalloprotease n=1 Tax=Piscinibacter aquaticus TaxID=392597 RepID=A0A5C6U4L4_9BURK|nr:CPBP family intramembrane metalloprotease [Piscinibacter aquaticus]
MLSSCWPSLCRRGAVRGPVRRRLKNAVSTRAFRQTGTAAGKWRSARSRTSKPRTRQPWRSGRSGSRQTPSDACSRADGTTLGSTAGNKDGSEMTTSTASYLKRLLPVWAVGALGVLALWLQEPPAALLEQAPQLRDLPVAGVKALLLLNPLLIMTALAAIGAALAHRVGLRSRPGRRPARRNRAGAGTAGGPWRRRHTGRRRRRPGRLARRGMEACHGPGPGRTPWPALAIGMLYGGLAEEVMMRWGVMSLLAWALWRAGRRSSASETQPSRRVVWAAIGASALVFALAHLPAVAQSAPLSPALVARTLALNALGGIVYGWLYWRRGLESAMLAHASTHAGLALVRAVA